MELRLCAGRTYQLHQSKGVENARPLHWTLNMAYEHTGANHRVNRDISGQGTDQLCVGLRVTKGTQQLRYRHPRISTFMATLSRRYRLQRIFFSRPMNTAYLDECAPRIARLNADAVLMESYIAFTLLATGTNSKLAEYQRNTLLLETTRENNVFFSLLHLVLSLL